MANLTGLRALLVCAAALPATVLAQPSVDQQQLRVVPLGEQGAYAVGGYYHQSLAQVVTAGRAGTLVAIAAPAVCSAGSSMVVEIRGVRAADDGAIVPDGNVRASATIPASALPYFANPDAPDFRMLPLAAPVPLAAGERFSFVLGSAGECALVQAPTGDLYAGGDGWAHDDVNSYTAWTPFLLDRQDLPFQTWMGEAAPPAAAEVRIDVKPGSDENPVNLGARGTIPVAILGSASFDVRSVDLRSIAFAGASPVPNRRGQPKASLEDVNGDGFADLVLHFPVPALKLRAGDREATLTGSTLEPDAVDFTATDRVRVVPAWKRRGFVF